MGLHNGLLSDLGGFLKENPLATSIGAGVVALGATGIIIASSRKKAKKRTNRISRRKATKGRTKRIKHRTSTTGKLRRHKTKHRGGKAIHFTKKGQPYIILATGKARFIKKTKRRTR